MQKENMLHRKLLAGWEDGSTQYKHKTWLFFFRELFVCQYYYYIIHQTLYSSCLHQCSIIWFRICISVHYSVCAFNVDAAMVKVGKMDSQRKVRRVERAVPSVVDKTSKLLTGTLVRYWSQILEKHWKKLERSKTNARRHKKGRTEPNNRLVRPTVEVVDSRPAWVCGWNIFLPTQQLFGSKYSGCTG